MKYSAYFLKKKGVDEQYFEGTDVADATKQAQVYAKANGYKFSSLWEMKKLTAAGAPIVNKEAKGRLDERGSKGASYGKGEYGDHGKSGYKSHDNGYKAHKGGYKK